jgi:SAM-dependent methyltransferase/peptidoglycan/xylan/chitin deacetylase (PgdA/CDA1 family)
MVSLKGAVASVAQGRMLGPDRMRWEEIPSDKLGGRLAAITIDVESRRSDPPEVRRRAIFGRRAEGEFGIHRIIDVLAKHKLPGTFFVDFSMYYFDRVLLDETLEALAKRGCEIGLHLHWSQMPEEVRQTPDQLIGMASAYFATRTGKRPVAHRGGAYEIDKPIGAALRTHGYRAEYSYFRGALDSCSFYDFDPGNSLGRYGDFLVVPVTTYARPTNKLDVNTMPTDELLAALEALPFSTLFLHGMSFLKPWHDGARLTDIDADALARFEAACERLARLRTQVLTAEQLLARFGPPQAKESASPGSGSTQPPATAQDGCNMCGAPRLAAKEYNGRPNALCGSCRSLERHRVFYELCRRYFFRELGFKNKKLLSIAPAPCIMRYCFQDAKVTRADIRKMADADIELDITNMSSVAGASYDAVDLFGVLHHCYDDARAVAECHRVLKPGGILYVWVPARRNVYTKVNEVVKTNTYGDQALAQHRVGDYRVYGELGMVKLLSSHFVVKTYYATDPLTGKEDIVFVGFKEP